MWWAAVQVFIALVGYGVARAQQAPPSTVLAPEEPRIFVARFRITGSTVFPPEELRGLIADGEGKELTLAQTEALAGRITAFYQRSGYILARAYVPAQEIREGVLEIAVLEGRIGRVEVEGARHYSPDHLRSYLKFPEPWRSQRLFHADDFERGLLLLNDLPGLEVKSTLKPGAEVGTVDVVLNVERDRLVTGSVDINNHGATTTGRYRFGLSFDLDNPFGLGDVASLRGILTDEDLQLGRLSYTLPVGTWGMKVGGAYTRVDVSVGGRFEDLRIVSVVDVVSLYLTYPFIRGRALSLYGQLGLDHKQYKTTIQGEQGSEDRLRVATAGLAVTAVDGWRGLTNWTLTLHQGIGDFLGGLAHHNDPDASRAGAGGTFTKLTADAARLQLIYGPTFFFLRASGQRSTTELTSPEQFSIGGQGTVRGYPLAEISGEHGYTFSGEFRWNAPGFSDALAFLGKTWGEILQFFAFADHGSISVMSPSRGSHRVADISGAGVGVRLDIPDTLFLSVEYARPFDGRRPSDKLDHVLYFQIATRF